MSTAKIASTHIRQGHAKPQAIGLIYRAGLAGGTRPPPAAARSWAEHMASLLLIAKWMTETGRGRAS